MPGSTRRCASAEDTGQLTIVGIGLSRQAEIAARRGAADRFEELSAAAARYAGTAAPVHAYERNSRCLIALGTGRPDLSRLRPGSRPSAMRSSNSLPTLST